MNDETPSATLGLDPELVARVLQHTRQWGEAVSRKLDEAASESELDERQQSDREALRREAASLMTIAGSYSLLVDTGYARDTLAAAADHYARLGSSFAHPLAVCGTNWDVAETARSDDDRPLTPAQRANHLLALSWLDVTPSDKGALDAVRRQLQLGQLAAASPVGRMQLPLDATLKVISAAETFAHEGNGFSALAASLHDALIRMHDVTRAAMKDAFHWRRLMSSVLPVEPEAAALGTIVMTAARRHGADTELLGGLDLPPVALVPLVIGREIARSTG